jgi:hypothetical protein
MLWLAIGLAVGVLTSASATPWVAHDVSRLTPLFWHFLTVGWATQLIFGVAYWMFPPWSRERPYRSPRLAWAVFVLLNAGLVARLLAEGVPVTFGSAVSPAWCVLSAAAQRAAGIGFVLNTWSRVRVR